MKVSLIEAKLSHDIFLSKEILLFFFFFFEWGGYHDYNILSLKKKKTFHIQSMQ